MNVRPAGPAVSRVVICGRPLGIPVVEIADGVLPHAKPLQLFTKLGQIGTENGEPFVHLFAAILQSVGHARQGKRRRLRSLQKREKPLRISQQPRPVSCRQHEHIWAGKVAVASILRKFFEDNVGIGSAETEGADPCPPRQHHTSLIPQRLPWLGLVHDVQGCGKFDCRVQCLKVDRFDKCLMLEA